MRPLALVLIPLALSCAGCAQQHGTPLHFTPAITAPDAPWWDSAPDSAGASAHDPLLAALIEQGLHHDPALLCRNDALALRLQKARDRKLKTRLTRLIAPDDTPDARQGDTYALMRSREVLAVKIALAYIEVRRWQERIALRTAALAPLRDNAEIARFRREAGLVSALDGDMADLMTGLDSSSVEAARGHLDTGIAALAKLTGALPEDLRVRLGPDGKVPDMGQTDRGQTDRGSTSAPTTPDLSHRVDLQALQTRLAAHLAHAKVTQQQLDAALANPDDSTHPELAQWREAATRARAELQQASDALATATMRLAALAQNETLALRAQSDARLAYRSGTTSFAALYVAEGVALAAQERQVDARAAMAGSTVALWHAQGLGWTSTQLAPALSGTVCDQP